MHRHAIPSLTGLLLCAALPAQTIDGQVHHNADDTVTYSLQLDGPPLALAHVFVSPFWSPTPLPTPFGDLLLDPLLLFDVGTAVVDPVVGFAQVDLTLPPAIDGIPLSFQGVLLSTANIDLTHNALATAQGAGGALPAPPPVPPPPPQFFGAKHNGNVARITVGDAPDTVYTVRIYDATGAENATFQVTIPDSGQITVASSAAELGPGYSYQIDKQIDGGQSITRWSGSLTPTGPGG